MKRYLALDIGGTFLKLGLVDEEGNVLSQDAVAVSYDGYRTPIMETTVRAVRSFVSDSSVEISSLEGIGVAAAGQIDTRRGLVTGSCGNLPGWDGTPIKGILEAEFSLPTTVLNDANAMCLGEGWKGRARGCRDYIGITLGTGVGGGIVVDGHLLEGFRGLGGEIGHFQTHGRDGLPCTCGNTGCFEQYASVTALLRNAVLVDTCWTDGRTLFSAAEKGDERALALLDDWTSEIARGLVGLIHIFNPQMVLVGGGVSTQETLLIKPLEKKIQSSLMPAFVKDLVIARAECGNEAGILGAVAYFRANRG